MVCRGGFKQNSDEHLQHGVACFCYASLLLLHPELKKLSDQQLEHERELLSQDGLPDYDAVSCLLKHKDPTRYCNRHQVCPHPANWLIWSAEKICPLSLSNPIVLFAKSQEDGVVQPGSSPGAEFEDAGDSDTPATNLPRLAIISPPAAPFMQVAVDGTLLIMVLCAFPKRYQAVAYSTCLACRRGGA